MLYIHNLSTRSVVAILLQALIKPEVIIYGERKVGQKVEKCRSARMPA